MAERRFQILKFMQKAPSTATCEACHLKFFVSMELGPDPVGAEQHLQQN
jgi:hypothetical protein